MIFYQKNMKKIINILTCGLILTFIEFILLTIFFKIEDKLLYDIPLLSFVKFFKASSEVILLKFLFYFAIWFLVIYFKYENLKGNKPFLRLAILNAVLYIVTSLIMVIIIPGTIEFFTRSFFFYLVIITFLSPIVLSIFPKAYLMIDRM
jgi:hypothetical protein